MCAFAPAHSIANEKMAVCVLSMSMLFVRRVDDILSGFALPLTSFSFAISRSFYESISLSLLPSFAHFAHLTTKLNHVTEEREKKKSISTCRRRCRRLPNIKTLYRPLSNTFSSKAKMRKIKEIFHIFIFHALINDDPEC